MHRIYNILLVCFGLASTVNNGRPLLLFFVLFCFLCSISFIQVNQEFLVETNTTVNNTGEDIMGETGGNTVLISEDNSANENYFLPLERFQTCSSQSQYEWSLSEDKLLYILKQFHNFILDAELVENILKCNSVSSNMPPPAPLDEFWRWVLEENHKNLQLQQDKILQKNAVKDIKCSSVQKLAKN